MKVKPGRDPGEVEIELGINEEALPGLDASKRAIFKLKRILIPVDLTEGCEKALQYGIAFARQFDAELNLLSVVERYAQVPELAPMAFEPIEDIRKKLEEVAAPVKAVVPTAIIVRTGEPSWEIISAASELNIDLIILSTHGRTGLSRLLIGSTAEKVVRRAGCPVLIVRNQEHEFVAEPYTGR